MHNATHEVIPKRCSLYKQPRSERWYARIKMDDGNWYSVVTKELELETAKSRALELYYEATIKGKNNLTQNTQGRQTRNPNRSNARYMLSPPLKVEHM